MGKCENVQRWKCRPTVYSPRDGRTVVDVILQMHQRNGGYIKCKQASSLTAYSMIPRAVGCE